MWILCQPFKRLRFSRLLQCFPLLLLFCVAVVIYFYCASDDQDYQHIPFSHTSVGKNQNYLVSNSKCQMLSINTYDPSIRPFIEKEKFEPCSTEPRLTRISRQANGSIYLTIDSDVVKSYHSLSCCWAAVDRPKTPSKHDQNIDSKISVGTCHKFDDRVHLDISVEVVYVSCYKTNLWTLGREHYKNTHAVINPKRARSRLRKRIAAENSSTNSTAHGKSLSVLMLGIDSVSRLNFYRTMPATRAYFEERGWTELRGYNKMGDNTFPNLMAILSGNNQSWVRDKCQPQTLYGMDNCSMIWYNYRDAGYTTAYAEDQAEISTFNYLKVGFVEPPTDYYLRPYLLATERLLKIRKRFYSNYCTGPELSVDRVFDYAVDFAKAFLGSPYFGFFWTNTISHESMNGPSLYDTRFLAKLQDLETSGAMNDSMIVMLSDHGMRYGDIRDTFVGWYEERLPLLYIWLPQWFRERNPEAYKALRVNQNRLSSPYDLYETLRDILQRAGGQAAESTGCSLCSSLFKPLPLERGCKEAGITPHWCTCAGFEPYDMSDPIVIEGANRFVDHMESIVERYKDERGNRLCSQPRLKRIIRVNKMLDLEQDPKGKVLKLFYLLEVTPGGGKFETTISYSGPGNYTIRDDEVSRINMYGHNSKCLNEGFKQYCHCGFWHDAIDFLFGG